MTSKQAKQLCVTYKDPQNRPQTKITPFSNNDYTFSKHNHDCVQYDFEYIGVEVISVQYIRTL